MKFLFKILIPILYTFSTFAQENTQTGEVHLNDSTNIYYFDLFNDKRAFHWDTISTIFNFRNYRFYFKNNSTDTLLAGSVKTGDGRVTYHYAGQHKLILPGEYFILEAMHNGSREYRIGRFSKNVSMRVLVNDTTLHFNHRYVGWYSKNDTSGWVPDVKLEEPMNTYPTQYERQFLQKLYNKRMENSAARRKERRKELQDKLLHSDNERDSIVEREVKPVLAERKRIQGEMHIYFRGRDENILNFFAESSTGDRQLTRVIKKNYNPYFLLTNPDSLEEITLYTKNSEGRKMHVQKIELTHHRDVRSDFRGYCTYFNKIDSSIVFTSEYLKSLKPVRIEFLIITRLRSPITPQCEMQALENGRWVEIPLKSDENKNQFFNYETEIDSYHRKVRWKRREDSNWNLDWIYLYRTNPQYLTVDSLWNAFGIFGRYHVQFKQNHYRVRTEDDLQTWRTKEAFVDSVKEVMRWYGIPIVNAHFETIRLKNDADNVRAQRALNRHFKNVILMPMYKGFGESDWIDPTVRVEFLKDVTEEQINTLLRQIGFQDFYIFKHHDAASGGLTVTINFTDIISSKHFDRLNALYERRELYSLRTEKAGIARADEPD